MTVLTPKAKLPYAELTDAPNMQTYSQALATALDSMVIPKYSLRTDRDAANPTPTSGDFAYVEETELLYQYRASTSSWVVTGPRFTLLNSDFALNQNSTTLQNVTGLLLPVEANSVYSYTAAFGWFMTTVCNIKFNFTGPAGATMPGQTIFRTTALNQTSVWNTNLIGVTRSMGGQSPTYETCLTNGTIFTSSTEGNIQVQAAQDTAQVGSGFAVGKGSYFTITKVS